MSDEGNRQGASPGSPGGTNQGGKGCCSLFSCCGGCLGGFLAVVFLCVASGYAAWRYLPSYLESASKERPLVPAGPNRPNEKEYRKFKRKIEAFASGLSRASSGSSGARREPVELELSAAEVNAWLAEGLLSPEFPLKLKDGRVFLLDGGCRLLLRGNGAELASSLPDTEEFSWMKSILSRAGTVDVDVTIKGGVKAGRPDISADTVRVGPFPVPCFIVNQAIDRALAGGNLETPWGRVDDLLFARNSVKLSVVPGSASPAGNAGETVRR